MSFVRTPLNPTVRLPLIIVSVPIPRLFASLRWYHYTATAGAHPNVIEHPVPLRGPRSRREDGGVGEVGLSGPRSGAGAQGGRVVVVARHGGRRRRGRRRRRRARRVAHDGVGERVLLLAARHVVVALVDEAAGLADYALAAGLLVEALPVLALAVQLDVHVVVGSAALGLDHLQDGGAALHLLGVAAVSIPIAAGLVAVDEQVVGGRRGPDTRGHHSQSARDGGQPKHLQHTNTINNLLSSLHNLSILDTRLGELNIFMFSRPSESVHRALSFCLLLKGSD